jgi:hypothetical protein
VGGCTSGGALHNSTLPGNPAVAGCGGGSWGSLKKCIVYYNTASAGSDYSFSYLNFCCTAQQPDSGLGNFTNAPLFLDPPADNFRLQSNSPCINAGLKAYAASGFDLDGNPRIVGGTVDVGAYEFQSPQSVISYAWLQQYNLPSDGSADFTDPDGDGLNNWQEWRCRTDPTNALSVLRLLSSLLTHTNLTVTWESAPGVNYFLERCTNLGASPLLFTPVATGIPGQPGTTAYTDTNAVGRGPFFYRVGVGN